MLPISNLQEIPGCKDLIKKDVDKWLAKKGEDMSIHYEASEELKSVLRARGLL